MKHLLLVLLILLTTNTLFSQDTCISKMDSNAVIKIAKKKNIYRNNNWPTHLAFNSSTCEWTFISGKTKHSNKGDCRYTNGCTIVTSATLVINATTKKIIRLEKQEKLYHNYE